MSSIKRVFALLICLNFIQTFATHVVGGEIMYSHLSGNQYRIQLDLYIDCQFGNPGAIADDKIANLFVFGKNSGKLMTGYPMEVWRSLPERLVKLHYNCLVNAPNACVDYYTYDTIMELPPVDGGYIVSFQRCCRNYSISNLLSPGAQGANYWTTIPDAQTLPDSLHNSSAFFTEMPPNFLCTNAKLQFDHSATDVDGDSLAYDLFQPYLGANNTQPRPDNKSGGNPDYPPFAHIVWLAPYNEINPIDGNPALQINAITGLLTITPTKVGQYVIGIRVREFRKGILISETRRDYQFNVSECNLLLDPGPGATELTCNNQVYFQNNSIGAVRYSWDFGVASVSDDTSNLKSPNYLYPAPGIYRAVLKVFRSNCTDSAITMVRFGKHAAGNLIASGNSCELTASAAAQSDAGAILLYFDDSLLTKNPIKLTSTNGKHIFKAVYIDTLAACNDSALETVLLDKGQIELRLANVFTPNDDGYNDCYKIGGDIGYCFEGDAKIYNRWGELIWETHNLHDCWNGKVNNGSVALPSGTYFYLIHYGEIGVAKRNTVTGSITLIRNSQ